MQSIIKVIVHSVMNTRVIIILIRNINKHFV